MAPPAAAISPAVMVKPGGRQVAVHPAALRAGIPGIPIRAPPDRRAGQQRAQSQAAEAAAE